MRAQAAELLAGQLAADRVPPVRAIRAQLHVGQPRAQRLPDYRASGAVRQVDNPAVSRSRRWASSQWPRLEEQPKREKRLRSVRQRAHGGMAAGSRRAGHLARGAVRLVTSGL